MGSYFGSFRVRVNREDFDAALQPQHWPAGWSVREYFVARQKSSANKDSDQGQPDNTQKH